MSLVYHYTSPEAMLSILRKRALWFSDCEFMNDPVEIAYCYRLYDEAWAEVCCEAGVPEGQISRGITSQANPYECESPVGEELGFSVPARYYSFSTCMDADNLAMWSCYACKTDKTGYALGFDSEVLEGELCNLASLGMESGVYFDSLSDKVCYSEKEQRGLIKHLIGDYLAHFGVTCGCRVSLLDHVLSEEIARGNHWIQVSAAAPFVKRPVFSYEREHRFVLRLSQFLMAGSEHYQEDKEVGPRRGWRLGASGVLIPYYELSFGRAFTEALREIRIMYPGDSCIAVNSTRRLLDDLGYQHVVVAKAGVRLRRL